MTNNHELFKLPDFVNKMMEANKWLGSKTVKRFYKNKEKKKSCLLI